MAAYWEIAAQSAYDMLYKYLIVNLFFPPRFWSGSFFLIAPLPCTFSYMNEVISFDQKGFEIFIHIYGRLSLTKYVNLYLLYIFHESRELKSGSYDSMNNQVSCDVK